MVQGRKRLTEVRRVLVALAGLARLAWEATPEGEMGLGLVNYFYFIFEVIRLAVQLGGLTWIAAAAHWSIPLLIFGSALPVLRLLGKYNIDRYTLVTRQTPKARLMHYIASVILGRGHAKEVRLYGLGDYLTRRWEVIYDELRLETARQRFRQRVGRGLIESLPLLAFGVSVAVLVVRSAGGHLSPGEAVAAVYACLSMLDQTDAIVDYLGEVHGYSIHFTADLLELLRVPQEVEEMGFGERPDPATAPLAASSPAVTGASASSPVAVATTIPSWPRPFRIVVRDLVFRYPGAERPVLDGISFELAPGEKVAIVGENGAGKSTLVKLLMGLYRPDAGVIELDGVDIGRIDPRALRREVSAVFQDYAHYHLTLRENIGFGDVARVEDLEAVRQAAALGGAVEVARELPDGYESFLGPTFGGRDLSGGQWQKTATSRAWMRRPKLVILDEPTAALDPRAEFEVYRRFQEMAGERTALLISHRIGFARLADRILVLKDGRLVENGDHAQLLRLDGEYARLYRAQAQWYA